MLALVAATAPGPFGRRTPLLGRYLGIRDGGRLVAMAGERLRVPGHVEHGDPSAVGGMARRVGSARAAGPASMPAAVRSKERLKVAKRTMGVGVSESFWLLQPAINPREMAAASRVLWLFFIVIFRSINRLCQDTEEAQAGPL